MVLVAPKPEPVVASRLRRRSAQARAQENLHLTSRQGGAWTADEDARLCREHAAGVPFETMCAAHERSARDVRERLARLQPWASDRSLSRRGSRWSQREEARLVREHDNGVPLATMAAYHGRPEDEIMAVLVELAPWDRAPGPRRRAPRGAPPSPRSVDGLRDGTHRSDASESASEAGSSSVELVPGATPVKVVDGVATGIDVVLRASPEPEADDEDDDDVAPEQAPGRVRVGERVGGLYALTAAFLERSPKGVHVRGRRSTRSRSLGCLRHGERAVVAAIIDGWAMVTAILRGPDADAPWKVLADDVAGWISFSVGGLATLERVQGVAHASLGPGVLARLAREARACSSAGLISAAYALSMEHERLKQRFYDPADEPPAPPEDAPGFDDDLRWVRRCAEEEVRHQRREFEDDADAYCVRGDAFKTWYAGKLTDFKCDERRDVRGERLDAPLSPLAYRLPSPPEADVLRERSRRDPGNWFAPTNADVARVALE